MDAPGPGPEQGTEGQMTVTVRSSESSAVVAVSGDVGAGTAPTLRARIESLVERETPRQVVLDLSDVDFVDSSGLGTIVRAHKHLRKAGGTLSLVVTSDTVLRVFQMSGLDRVLVVHPSLDDALAADR